MTPDKEEIKTIKKEIKTTSLDEETEKFFRKIMEDFKEAWIELSKRWGGIYLWYLKKKYLIMTYY